MGPADQLQLGGDHVVPGAQGAGDQRRADDVDGVPAAWRADGRVQHVRDLTAAGGPDHQPRTVGLVDGAGPGEAPQGVRSSARTGQPARGHIRAGLCHVRHHDHGTVLGSSRRHPRPRRHRAGGVGVAVCRLHRPPGPELSIRGSGDTVNTKRAIHGAVAGGVVWAFTCRRTPATPPRRTRSPWLPPGMTPRPALSSIQNGAQQSDPPPARPRRAGYPPTVCRRPPCPRTRRPRPRRALRHRPTRGSPAQEASALSACGIDSQWYGSAVMLTVILTEKLTANARGG